MVILSMDATEQKVVKMVVFLLFSLHIFRPAAQTLLLLAACPACLLACPLFVLSCLAALHMLGHFFAAVAAGSSQ